MTRARIDLETDAPGLKQRDTADCETRASLATSYEVARPPSPRGWLSRTGLERPVFLRGVLAVLIEPYCSKIVALAPRHGLSHFRPARRGAFHPKLEIVKNVETHLVNNMGNIDQHPIVDDLVVLIEPVPIGDSHHDVLS